MQILTIEPRRAQVGDRLTEIDGIEIKPMTIDREPSPWGASTTALHLKAPEGSSIEWQRYVDEGQFVTVERDEPEVTVRAASLTGLLNKALTPKREVSYPRRVTRNGVRLVQKEKGGAYYTEDDKYLIDYSDGYMTECDSAHPVRYSKDVQQQALDDAYYKSLQGRSRISWRTRSEARHHLLQGRHGYLCPGGAEHMYGMWELQEMGPDGQYIDTVDRGETMSAILAGLPAEYHSQNRKDG